MDFHLIEENLRQSFRALVPGRPFGRVVELPGVSIASLGVEFQMFNAAFLSARVDNSDELKRRIETARGHFDREGIPWSFWVCEDWLGWLARRKLGAVFGRNGLRCSSEMPGMAATALAPLRQPLPRLDLRRVDSAKALADFRMVGALCFHVPGNWFAEVFDSTDPEARPGFRTLVGYLDGEAVATAAYVASPATAGPGIAGPGAVGLYNIATIPAKRGRGIGEAVTRLAADAARAETGRVPVVLQSSAMGRDLYQRLGFKTVARISVYNS